MSADRPPSVLSAFGVVLLGALAACDPLTADGGAVTPHGIVAVAAPKPDGVSGAAPERAVWDALADLELHENTPLVVSFDGRPAELAIAATAAFDIDGREGCLTTDWPTTATPWLAIDDNGDGVVDSGAELFGSGRRLPDGQSAKNGFAALAALDSNGDRRITPQDERFGELLLWLDEDADKLGTFSEFIGLQTAGIVEIELDYRYRSRCDVRGNCQIEHARFSFVDASGAVQTGQIIDVHLACQ